jgi:serine/threonine-protein kinase
MASFKYNERNMSEMNNYPSDPAPTAAFAPNSAAEAPTLAPPAANGPAPEPAADTHSASAPPGYEILEELGRGGMGVVYKARQLSLQRTVALKMILTGCHAGASELARFRGEAEAVARLQHPNIVQVYEVGEAEGRPFFSLEFVDGGSLADWLDGTPQPVRQAADLVETVARAVHAAHQHSIIHRDLKPANVLLQIADCRVQSEEPSPPAAISKLPSAMPKIADFGLAKRMDSGVGQTASGAILGTPSYMAPEQAGGRSKEIGPATDVYALGAILYELLTGRPPFRAETPLDTVLQVVSEEPVPPSRLQSKLPRDLETICLKCLQKEPRKRYDTALDLADDLGHFLADEPIRARPARPWERAWKWARRRPAVAGLLVVSTAALATLVVGALVYSAKLQESNKKLEASVALAVARNEALLRAQEETKLEHQRAQTHLNKALEAVDRMLTKVGDERLANLPQFADLRREVLEEALTFYQGFLRQESKEPAVRRETARAQFRIASLNLWLANDRVQTSCEEAIQLQEQLVAEFPEAPEYHYDLGKSYDFLGHVYQIRGDYETSRKMYQKALAINRWLLERYPENTEYQASLTNDYLHLGYSHLHTDVRMAEVNFREVIRLGKQLVQAHPDAVDYRCLVAGAYDELSLVLRLAGRRHEAQEALNHAFALLQPADRPPPRAAKDYPHALALAQAYQGELDLRASRLTRAETNLCQGVAGFEQLLQQSPKHLVYRMQLAMSYPLLGELYGRTNRRAKADEAFQKAVSIIDQLAKDYPNVSWIHQLAQHFHAERAAFVDQLKVIELVQLVQRGEVEKAVAEAQAFAAKNLPGDVFYNLACVYALAAKATAADPSRAEERARRAVALLAQAEGRGYFRDRRAVEHAKKDDDLNSLRQRDDFQKFMTRVEKQTQPARPRPTRP